MRIPQEREPISDALLESWGHGHDPQSDIGRLSAELRELRKENARLKHVAATFARIVQGRITREDIAWAHGVIEAMKGESA